MKIYKTPTTEDISDEKQKNLHEFFLKVIDLCNEYRITFSIGQIFFLRHEVFDGKLLDVAGFSYDKDSKHTYPVYIDRMSNDGT